MIIYNQETDAFDLEHLKLLGASKALLQFYSQKGLIPYTANQPEFHNSWLKLVSDLPRAIYSSTALFKQSPNFNLKPCTKNFFAVFSHLFPKATPVSSWVGLASRLSLPRCKVTFPTQPSLSMTITKENFTASQYICIDSKHCYLELPNDPRLFFNFKMLAKYWRQPRANPFPPPVLSYLDSPPPLPQLFCAYPKRFFSCSGPAADYLVGQGILYRRYFA